MKSKDQSGSEDISADERKLPTVTTSQNIVCKIRCFIFSMFQQSFLVQFTHQKLVIRSIHPKKWRYSFSLCQKHLEKLAQTEF